MEDFGLVSIIVPTYKRHKEMVNRAILSLINQTYKNIEIVLVDDNARPDLREYRQEIEAMVLDINDDRIKLVQNESNLGGAGSRNNGARVARGIYITFLDDDDMYLSEKIEHQVKYIYEQGCDMCFTNLNLYNEKDELIDVRSHNDVESFDNTYLMKYHLTKQITGTPTFMLKKELFDKIGGFEIVPMGQEYYLMYKIIKSNAKICYLNCCDIKAYRYDIEAISTGKDKIPGERKLYKFKKSNFKLLSLKERRYTRCRHNAVMGIAYKRNKKYIRCMLYLMYAIIVSPFDAIREVSNLNKRKKEAKKHE